MVGYITLERKIIATQCFEKLYRLYIEYNYMKPYFISTEEPAKTLNILYKTRYCRNILNWGHCPFGKRCIFAHNIEELRPPPLIT